MKKYPKPNWSFYFYKTWDFKWMPHYAHLRKVLWKDKFASPRTELEPHYRFEWLWFGFRAQQGDDQLNKTIESYEKNNNNGITSK